MGADRTRPPCSEKLAPRLGVVPTITEAAVSEGNVGLALGNRCISIGHKTQVTNSTLLALSEAGVTYISTRSVGYNHIDVEYAEAVGIRVETVAYSPDSVADYTLMLMLMAVRHAKSVIRRTDVHDYRLNDVRGKELRDLTIGVIGTGRIGGAVMDRLRGFGCRTLAYDTRPSDLCRLRLSRCIARAERHRDAPHAAHRGDTPSPRSPPDRADEARRGHRQHRTRRACSIPRRSSAPWKAADWAARRWTSSKERKGSSTPTAARRPSKAELLLRLHKLPNVLISPHTAYYTDHALRDTVEQSMTNCLKFAGRASMDRLKVGDHLRRLLRGTSDLRQVGARGREAPRSREVRAVLHRDHARAVLGSSATALTRTGRTAVPVRPCCRRTEASTDCWSWRGPARRYETISLDLVLPVLHGKLGEDGAIQGLLELSGIPYAGCDVQSSALCMDKSLAYMVASSAGIATPNFWTVTADEDIDPDQLTYPVFVKPARSGSSFGVSKVSRKEELPSCGADRTAVRLEGGDRGGGRRQRGRMRRPGERPGSACRRGRSDRAVSRLLQDPSGERARERVRELDGDRSRGHLGRRHARSFRRRQRRSIAPWVAAGSRGWTCSSRRTDTVVLNEVNTLPGMTSYSRYPRMMAAAGLPLAEVIDRIVSLALAGGRR